MLFKQLHYLLLIIRIKSHIPHDMVSRFCGLDVSDKHSLSDLAAAFKEAALLALT